MLSSGPRFTFWYVFWLNCTRYGQLSLYLLLHITSILYVLFTSNTALSYTPSLLRLHYVQTLCWFHFLLTIIIYICIYTITYIYIYKYIICIYACNHYCCDWSGVKKLVVHVVDHNLQSDNLHLVPGLYTLHISIHFMSVLSLVLGILNICFVWLFCNMDILS